MMKVQPGAFFMFVCVFYAFVCLCLLNQSGITCSDARRIQTNETVGDGQNDAVDSLVLFDPARRHRASGEFIVVNFKRLI